MTKTLKLSISMEQLRDQIEQFLYAASILNDDETLLSLKFDPKDLTKDGLPLVVKLQKTQISEQAKACPISKEGEVLIN